MCLYIQPIFIYRVFARILLSPKRAVLDDKANYLFIGILRCPKGFQNLYTFYLKIEHLSTLPALLIVAELLLEEYDSL
jgi:hypothetical protein